MYQSLSAPQTGLEGTCTFAVLWPKVGGGPTNAGPLSALQLWAGVPAEEAAQDPGDRLIPKELSALWGSSALSSLRSRLCDHRVACQAGLRRSTGVAPSARGRPGSSPAWATLHSTTTLGQHQSSVQWIHSSVVPGL